MTPGSSQLRHDESHQPGRGMFAPIDRTWRWSGRRWWKWPGPERLFGKRAAKLGLMPRQPSPLRHDFGHDVVDVET